MKILCDHCIHQNTEDRACSKDNTFKPYINQCHSFDEKTEKRKREDWHNIQMKPSRRIR